MTALVFLIFDVEVVFLYPWAVQIRELGWFGFCGQLSLFGNTDSWFGLRLEKRRAGMGVRQIK